MGRLTNILRPEEWIAALIGITTAAAIYLFLIHPSLELFSRHDAARELRQKAAEELAAAHSDFQRVQAEIVRNKARLSELGGAPPLSSQKDLQIARLTALANTCQVIVDQYLPVETVEESDHEAAFFQFSGRGEFRAIREYLRRTETELEFLDITHLSIATQQGQTGMGCTIQWSCRINGMKPHSAKPPPTLDGGSLKTAEVVLSEP